MKVKDGNCTAKYFVNIYILSKKRTRKEDNDDDDPTIAETTGVTEREGRGENEEMRAVFHDKKKK